MMCSQVKMFYLIGKKKELKTRCNFVIYSVKCDPLLPKWYDVMNLQNKHKHMVRLDEVEGQPTCTCSWGSHMISSGDFSIECWHIKTVRASLGA